MQYCVQYNYNIACNIACKLCYYCSKACQNGHWSAHKFCTNKGQFLSGDRVLIKGLVSRPELNDTVATITGNSDGRWVCEFAGGDQVKIKDVNLSSPASTSLEQWDTVTHLCNFTLSST